METKTKPSTIKRLDPAKHSTAYEAQFYVDGAYTSIEFAAKEEAAAAIEAAGSGSLIKWHIEPNVYWAKPDYVHKSLSLDVFDNGKWKEVNIF